jgi:shikimate kinase
MGMRLADSTGARFLDLDSLIVERAAPGDDGDPRSTIRDVYRSMQERAFRELEHETLAGVLQKRPAEPLILALGGGVAENRSALQMLRDNTRMLYLANDPLVLYDRATARGLPAFLDPTRPREHFLEIAGRRDSEYRRYAHEVVDLTGLSKAQAHSKLLDYL